MFKRSLLFTIILTLCLSAFAAPVALSDAEMVDLTMSKIASDDVVVIIKAPVKITPRTVRPDISREIRKLRRSDQIIYDSDKDGAVATTCLIIMIVPKENVAELIARVAADPSLALVTPDKEAAEADTFPELDALKGRVLTFVSTEGK